MKPRSRSSLHLRRVADQIRAHFEILEHGQVGEDAAPFGRHRDAARHELVSGQPGDVLALEADAPAPRREQPGDGAQRRGLAGAVGADQRDDLAGLDRAATRRAGLECAP